MEPQGVNKVIRWLVITGFAFTLCLLVSVSYAMLTRQGDLLSYLLFPCLIPLAFFFLLLVLYTKGIFQYSERRRTKEVVKFIRSIWGTDMSRKDITILRRDIAKVWHPDDKSEDFRQFANDVLSRINTYLNDLDAELKKNNVIDWERRQDDERKFA